ncbi:MAG: TonB-dependent receptor [Gammaproteobacteria bacterium]|nr:TonB-dependent receptor [Gammaproteobacteria bacterium]
MQANAAFPQFHNAFLRPPTDGCFVPPPFGTGSTDSTNPACFNGQWVPSDRDTEFGTVPAKDELDVLGLAGTIEWEVNSNLTVKSITSYRDTDSEFSLDEDHSPLTIAQVLSDSTHEQFTQEIQLLGTSFDDKLNWILGAYYFEEEGAYLERVTFSPVDFQSGGAVENDSLAFFAQGTYDFNDKLSITLGLRYTDDTKRFTPDQFIIANNNASVPPFLLGFGPGLVPPIPPPGFLLLPNTEAKISVQELDPMASIGYQWTEDLLTYFTYSEGFKSGGFTQRVFPPLAAAPSFQPEFVTVYEAGFKWQGFDNRVRLNGAFFFSDYEDLQIVSQANSVAPLVQNAGAAEVKGFELDLQAVPAENWLIEGGVGYIDGEYTEVDPGTGLGINNKLVKTPEWSGTAALAYTWDWADIGTITPRVDLTYRASYFSNAINSSTTAQDAFSLVNLGVTFESNDGKWMFSAQGRNLTNERYISAGYSEQNGPTANLGISEVIRDRGREWSLNLRRSFF